LINPIEVFAFAEGDVAFVLSPPLMEDTEASRAAKDLFRECAHPTIVVAMVARRAPVTDDRIGGGAIDRERNSAAC